MRSFLIRVPLIALATSAVALADIQHGVIRVIEHDGGNLPTSVTLTREGGRGVWIIDAATSNRADYTVDFMSASDYNDGVLITSVHQLERSEPSVAQNPYFCSPACDRQASPSDNYFVVVTHSPDGTEANFDTALGYFPIADGWLTAALYNAANNGPLASYVGTPGIEIDTEAGFSGIGTEVVDFTIGSYANGFYLLSSEGIDFRRDGLLLVSGAKNEDNRADVFTNYDGRAILHCIDNGAEGGGENDPVAFVFIPEGTAGVVMGQVTGSGRTLFKQGDFSVVMVGQPDMNGTFRITIPGQSPATGTLLACPHSELGGTSIDNVLFVANDGDGWLVTTRDIEPLPVGPTLQDLDSADIAFHFAFFPNDVAVTPGTPTRPYAARLGNVVSARFNVTELSSGNGNGECRADRVSCSDALDIYGDNLGDYSISWLGVRNAARTDNGLDTLEGVFLTSSSEFLRDNSATGGVSGWSTASFDNTQVHLHSASLAGGEINSNFAVAFFPASAGFLQDADVGTGSGLDSIDVGADAATDGVLMVNNWDNDNKVVTSTPGATVSTAYDLAFYDAATGLPTANSTEYGYVYLPYSTPGLVAGQIAADGTVLSGTGNFTTSSTSHGTFGFPMTTISITGVDSAADGVLLVTPTAGPIAMAWEPGAAGAFDVAGLDTSSGTIGQYAFSFAYIPCETSATPPECTGDINNDDVRDLSDLTILLSSFGTTTGDPGYNAEADLDGNGDVSLSDLAGLLSVFGTDCE